MQRIAVEVVVQAPWGPLRVTTTHLEYYSAMQRMAQVEGLRRLHEEACGHAANPRPTVASGDPFAALPRPASAILTGDFNFKPESEEYRRLTDAPDGGAPRLVDAWQLATMPSRTRPRRVCTKTAGRSRPTAAISFS